MSKASSSDSEFFEAFRWPLPTAFSAAVAACRFEQGDVLYRDARAYGEWSGRVPVESDAIQILDPPRSARGTVLDGDSDRRRVNWASGVRFLLIDPMTGETTEQESSQGKLLMALWTGDVSWLDADRAPPEFPGSGRELQAKLEDARPAVARVASKRRIRSGSQFVLVVDLASDASLAKARLVEDQLSAAGPLKIVDLLPNDAGIGGPGTYHPTLVLRVFTLDGRDRDSVERVLRDCLYQGGAMRSETTEDKTGRESSRPSPVPTPADRFSIGRHGLLISI